MGRRRVGDEGYIGRGGGEGWDKEEGEGNGEGSTPPVFSNTPSLNYLEVSLHLPRPTRSMGILPAADKSWRSFEKRAIRYTGTVPRMLIPPEHILCLCDIDSPILRINYPFVANYQLKDFVSLGLRIYDSA
jgi:hypothetical protein